MLYKIGCVRCCVSKLFVHNCGSSSQIKPACGSGQGVGEGLIKEGVDLKTIAKIDPKLQRINENITRIICEIGDVCECLF